jgi:hypothetical protein
MVYPSSNSSVLAIEICKNRTFTVSTIALGNACKICMNESIEIFGYHGTSRANAIRILNDGFRVSSNDYDWLGEGVYFFQDAPLRASQWAKEQYPEDPAIIRSLIRLENSIDLFDIKWFATLKAAYQSFKTRYERNNLPLPSQNPTRSKAHRLDCEFFDYITQLLLSQNEKVETIRAVFIEGESIFPNSAIFDLAHVQIAVRNTVLIQESQLIEVGDI